MSNIPNTQHISLATGMNILTIGVSRSTGLSPEPILRNTYPSIMPEASIQLESAWTGHRWASCLSRQYKWKGFISIQKSDYKKKWQCKEMVHTSKLVCFMVWQCKGHLVTIPWHFNMWHFDLENLIHMEQAQKHDSVNSLKHLPCESATPLMELGSILTRNRCVWVYFPISQEGDCGHTSPPEYPGKSKRYDQLKHMQWTQFRVPTEVIAWALVGVSPALT